MGKALHALGLFCARRSLVVIGIWVALVLVVFGVGRQVRRRDQQRPRPFPGPAARRSRTCWRNGSRLSRTARTRSSSTSTKGKLTDQANKQAINDVDQGDEEGAARLQRHEPDQQRRPDRRPAVQGRSDRLRPRAARHRVRRARRGDRAEDLRHHRARRSRPGSRSQAAGSIGSELSDQPTESSEVVGILAAMLILTLVLGQPRRDGAPDHLRRRRPRVALAIVGLAGHLVAMPDTGATLATMIGLGVGIDYALFLITRHQEHLASGMPMRRVDRAVGRHVRQRDRVRRRHGRGGSGLAAGRRHPAAEHPRSRLGRRRRDGRAGRDLVAPRPARPPRPADPLACASRHSCASRTPAARLLGLLGGIRGAAPVWVTARSLLFLAPLIVAGALAAVRPGGHRRHLTGDDRAPGLRPDHGRLRRRLQRPAPGGVEARPGGDTERRVHQEVQPGDVAPEAAGPGAEGAPQGTETTREAAEATREAAEVLAGTAGATRVSAAAVAGPEGVAPATASGPRTPGSPARSAGSAAAGEQASLEQQQAQLEREQRHSRRSRRGCSAQATPSRSRPAPWRPKSVRWSGSWPESSATRRSSSAASSRQPATQAARPTAGPARRPQGREQELRRARPTRATGPMHRRPGAGARGTGRSSSTPRPSS